MGTRILFFLKLIFLNIFFLCSGYWSAHFRFRFFIFFCLYIATILSFIFGFPIEAYTAAPFYMAFAYIFGMIFDALVISIFLKKETLKFSWNKKNLLALCALFLFFLISCYSTLVLNAHNMLTTQLWFASYPNMLPQFTEKSLVISRSWAWKKKVIGKKGLRRGDIVMFYEGEENRQITRRIIALPGERLSMKNGIATVNNKPFLSQFISNYDAPNEQGGTSKALLWKEISSDGKVYSVITKIYSDGDNAPETASFVIPENSVGVLSDNRPAWLKEEYKGAYIVPLDKIFARPVKIIDSNDASSNNKLVQ